MPNESQSLQAGGAVSSGRFSLTTPGSRSLLPRSCSWLAVSGLVLAYWLIAFHPESWTYLDYVDGYYLYVAHRMAQGAVLYSGILGVQPPGIYLLGAWLFRLHDSLWCIRCFSAVLHSTMVLLVYGCGWRLYRSHIAALCAALLYSVAPFSLLWSRIFDPNPLVTCLSLATLFLLLGGTRSGAAGAGLLGGLALITKIWYVPVLLVTLLFLAKQRRDLLPAFVVPLLCVTALACVTGSLIAGTAFWQGLVVQDASASSLSSFLVSLYRVAQYDWPLLLLAWAGGRTASFPSAEARSYARWYLFASSSIIIATLKSGTLWPIYQFAEPSLALAGAGYLARVFASAPIAGARPAGSFSRLAFLPLLLALVLWWAAPTLRDVGASADASVHVLVSHMQRASAPDSTLLAPPFYLYLSGRREFGEYADVNIWGLRDAQGDAQARALTQQVRQALSAGQIPLVLADFRVRNLPGVAQALRGRYHRLSFSDPAPVDRQIQLWAPGRE